MNLLEVFFIISGVIIFILALDIARKEKFNALHFFVFLMIGSGLLTFTFFPGVLNFLWSIFWLQRGADVLVYGSIIFLLYFVLLLLSKVESNKHNITKIIRESAIQSSEKIKYTWEKVILIRVYNEASVLEKTLSDIVSAGHENILLVDDGSSDDSYKIIEKFSKKYSNIIWIKHFENRGGGAALETGFEYIRRYLDVKYIITFDADGQHQISDISKFVKAFEKHPHLEAIFGSRFLGAGGYENMPLTRKIILKLGRIFTRIMSGARLTDSHNGYRAFQKSTLSKIHLTADSMAYASEMIEQIMKQGIAYAEVPVHILYSEYSLWKWQKSSNAIFIALHTIWSKFFK